MPARAPVCDAHYKKTDRQKSGADKLTKPLILAVVGPTASGKTDAALALAEKFGGEIVCCDSMQIYSHMKIGTAAPTDEELTRVRHHLYNFVNPSVNYNAALYQEEARKTIDDILKRNKVPILCGGTGLYLKAALFDMNFSLASSDDEYRGKLERLQREKGAQYLHDMLAEKDPKSAATIHSNNVKRVIRALEILHLSGVKKSDQMQEEKSHYKDFYIMGLAHERQALYDRINLRVDKMIKGGLEQEVRNLLDMGVSKKSNAMQAIGYKQWLDYFDKMISFEECVLKIKQASRNYAKRQLTWFNSMETVWYEYKTTVLHKYTNLFANITNFFFNS
jgi:tRNA dimethylallyltransferase